jgi:hypothetical protein
MSRNRSLTPVGIVALLVLTECAAVYVAFRFERTQVTRDAAAVATAKAEQQAKDRPDRTAAIEALRRLVTGPELGLGRPFQDENPLCCAEDVQLILKSIQDDMRSFNSQEIPHELGRPGFRIGGWRVHEDNPTFDRLFKLPGGRRFRLRGVFVRSTGGKWVAETTRLVPILPRAEASKEQTDNQDLNQIVELALTPVEAKAALLRWLRQLDHPDCARQFLDGAASELGSSTLQYLRSNECREELTNAAITEAENWYTIDRWGVDPDELTFIKRKPGGAADLLGHFEPTPNRDWKIVADSFVFDLGYTKGK